MAEQKSWNGALAGRVWNAAGYARLSVDDGEVGQSGSITNQQRIIDDWADERDDVTVVESFVDDGYSGSNFERPGFRAMMAAVDEGRVNCILVKDLSRLGRNYLETGRYMERVFPAKGVRLVAVNDGYDGLDAMGAGGEPYGAFDAGLLVPFKNLINDFYCATTSAKIKAALAVRRADGLYVGGMAPYGYLKDPADRNVLVADPVAAPVVARIFQMRASGESLAGIARVLGKAGVVSPSGLRRVRASGISGGVLGAEGDELTRWSPSTVGKILKERTYTGTLVQGRTFKPSFRQPDRVRRHEAMWSYSPGGCPAIVSEELFERVQRLNETALSGGGRRSENPLRGMVFCGACGKGMAIHACTAAGRRYEYYRCTAGCRPEVRTERVIAAVEEDLGSAERAFLLERMARVNVFPNGTVVAECAEGEVA